MLHAKQYKRAISYYWDQTIFFSLAFVNVLCRVALCNANSVECVEVWSDSFPDSLPAPPSLSHTHTHTHTHTGAERVHSSFSMGSGFSGQLGVHLCHIAVIGLKWNSCKSTHRKKNSLHHIPFLFLILISSQLSLFSLSFSILCFSLSPSSGSPSFSIASAGDILPLHG